MEAQWIEWVRTGILIVGLIFLGWYQRRQIKILKKELDSQKNILNSQETLLNNFKTVFDAVDIGKIKEFVKISEETVTMRKDKEIEEIRTQFEQTIHKEKYLRKSLERELKDISSLKETLVEKLEISTSKESEFVEKYKILRDYAVKFHWYLLKFVSVSLALMIQSLSLKELVIYSALGLQERYPDAPKTTEVFARLEEVEELLYEPLTTTFELALSSDLADPDVRMPDELERFEYKKCIEELESIRVSFSPYVDQEFEKADRST